MKKLTVLLALVTVATVATAATIKREIISTSQFSREANTNETAAGWRAKLGITGMDGGTGQTNWSILSITNANNLTNWAGVDTNILTGLQRGNQNLTNWGQIPVGNKQDASTNLAGWSLIPTNILGTLSSGGSNVAWIELFKFDQALSYPLYTEWGVLETDTNNHFLHLLVEEDGAYRIDFVNNWVQGAGAADAYFNFTGAWTGPSGFRFKYNFFDGVWDGAAGWAQSATRAVNWGATNFLVQYSEIIYAKSGTYIDLTNQVINSTELGDPLATNYFGVTVSKAVLVGGFGSGSVSEGGNDPRFLSSSGTITSTSNTFSATVLSGDHQGTFPTSLATDTELNTSSNAIKAAVTAGSVPVPSSALTGTVPTARLGSGTASSSTFLRGDQTFATPTTAIPDPASVGTMNVTNFYPGLTNKLLMAGSDGKLQYITNFSGITFDPSTGSLSGSGSVSAAEVAEIMATNAAGFALAKTNRTTSYYQLNTNTFTLAGAATTAANGVYTWNSGAGAYITTGAGVDMQYYPSIYITNNAGDYIYLNTFFPSAWTESGATGGAPPPSGSGFPFETNSVTQEVSTNAYAVFFPYGFESDGSIIQGKAQGNFIRRGNTQGQAVGLPLYSFDEYPSVVLASLDSIIEGANSFTVSSRMTTNYGQRVVILSSGHVSAYATNADLTIMSSEFGNVYNKDGVATIISSVNFEDFGDSSYTILNCSGVTNLDSRTSVLINANPYTGQGQGTNLFKVSFQIAGGAGVTNYNDSYGFSYGNLIQSSNNSHTFVLGTNIKPHSTTNNFLIGAGLTSTSNNVMKLGFTNSHIVVTPTGTTLPGTTTLQGVDTTTNLWAINTSMGLGTNAYYTGGAQTLGVTGIANHPTNTERFGQLVIKATGDIIFTNHVNFQASDYVDARTITNGNTAVIAVHVLPNCCTNLAIVQFR